MDLLITGDPNTYTAPMASLPSIGTMAGRSSPRLALPWVCRGAVVWLDYDGDGDLDILLTGQMKQFPQHRHHEAVPQRRQRRVYRVPRPSRR